MDTGDLRQEQLVRPRMAGNNNLPTRPPTTCPYFAAAQANLRTSRRWLPG